MTQVADRPTTGAKKTPGIERFAGKWVVLSRNRTEVLFAAKSEEGARSWATTNRPPRTFRVIFFSGKASLL